MKPALESPCAKKEVALKCHGGAGPVEAKAMLVYQHSGFSVDAGVCIAAHDYAEFYPWPTTGPSACSAGIQLCMLLIQERIV